MTTIAIDTLATMRKLEKAGFETVQAEAVAETVAEVVGSQGDDLATKADLKLVQSDLKAVEKSLRQEIAGLRWMFGLHFAFTLAMLGIMAALTWQVFTIGQEVAGIMAILTAG